MLRDANEVGSRMKKKNKTKNDIELDFAFVIIN